MSKENDDKANVPPQLNSGGPKKETPGEEMFEDLKANNDTESKPGDVILPLDQDVPDLEADDLFADNLDDARMNRDAEQEAKQSSGKRIRRKRSPPKDIWLDFLFWLQSIIQLIRGNRKQKCPYCLHEVRWPDTRPDTIPKCTNPTCNKTLPEDFLLQRTPIIAVVGGKNSGKSTFLTALIKQLLSNNKFLAEHQVDVNIENKAGKDKFDDYYESLYIRNERLEGNPIMVDNQAILIRLDRPGWNNSIKSIFLTFYDTPGEEFYDVDRLLEHHPNIHNADGILFLADPLNLEGIYEQLHINGRTNRWTDERLKLLTQSEYAILQNLRTVLRQKKKLNLKGKVHPPIAVCLSKFDIIEDLSPVDTENLEGSKTWTYSLEEVLVDIDEISEELYEWLKEVDPKFAGGVVNLFSKYHFFPVSPLGMPPEELKNREIDERGVLQPFLWLLREFRFM